MLLYVDAAAGVSGDMLLAGFLDMGLSAASLRQALDDLGLPGIRIHRRRIRSAGIRATQISIVQRSPRARLPKVAGELIDWVRRSRLSRSLKRSVSQALGRLARAESEVHHSPWRRALFHQLAQVDTLVDITGFCVGLEAFRIQSVYASKIPLGNSYQDARGRWQPRPGPATRVLLRWFPTERFSDRFEWTTPTGATLLAAFGVPDPPPPFEVKGIGRSVGHRRPPRGPSVLKLLWGRPVI